MSKLARSALVSILLNMSILLLFTKFSSLTLADNVYPYAALVATLTLILLLSNVLPGIKLSIIKSLGECRIKGKPYTYITRIV